MLRALFGVQAEHTDFNAGRYRSENRMLVYDRMHEEAERLLSIGMSVVLDGTYLASTLRDSARQLALRQKAELLTIRCHGPDQLVLQRIKDRMLRGGALSDARPDFFVQQQLSEEPDPPGQQSLSVDTSESLGDPMKKVFEALRRASFGDTT